MKFTGLLVYGNFGKLGLLLDTEYGEVSCNGVDVYDRIEFELPSNFEYVGVSKYYHHLVKYKGETYVLEELFYSADGDKLYFFLPAYNKYARASTKYTVIK